MVDIFTKQV